MKLRPLYPVVPPLAALLVLFGAPSLAAPPEEPAPSADRTFTGETTVTVVEVPVRVLKDGEPVTGLEAEDFRIFDQGEERPVLSVERVDLRESRAAVAASEPSPAARRHFLLLFDLAFTDAPYLRRAVEAGRDLIEEGLHPSDLVAVAFFNMREGLSEVVGFTPDHGQALRALDELAIFLGSDDERLGRVESEEEAAVEAPDPLRFTVGEWSAELADVGGAAERTRSGGEEALEILGANAAGGGRGADLGGLEAMLVIGETEMREVRASQASALVTSLGDLAKAMRWVDGAKYLVFFSRGFESTTYQGENAAWLLGELNRTVERFRQAGWSIHSIETTGELNTSNERRRREALFFLAHETGGTLMGNDHDLSRSMGRVLEETSVVYVLTFESPPLPADGAFRRLRVELASESGAPKGARVVHRAGYFTPKPFGEMDREERRAATAELVLGGGSVEEIGCRVLVSPAGDLREGRMRVPVIIDADAVSLLASRNWQATRVEMLAYAFDEAGRVAGTWGREFFLSPDTVVKAGRAESVVFYGELELPPGGYEVRSVIRNVDDGQVTLRSSRVWIPDASEGAPTLLEPIFTDRVDKGEEGAAHRILVRDATHGPEYPFVFREQRFLPVLAPAVLPGVEAVVIGRGIWDAPPRGLRANVFDREGFQVQGGVDLRLLGFADDEGQAVRQLAVGLRPSGLPAGDYELRFLFQDPDGTTVFSPPAAFRVVDAAATAN